MAKKSQRRAVRYEKDKSGCMWGFISMFDFRHGHATRKLIADRRRSSKHTSGGVHSKNKFEMLSNLDEACHGNSVSAHSNGESNRSTAKKSASHKHSVKKLIEEEMFIDQTEMKAEVESKESRLRHEVSLKADYKRKKKSSSKSRDMDTDEFNLDATSKSRLTQNQHSRQQSRDNLDLDKIIEEFCHLKGSVMRGDNEGVHGQSRQKHGISENIAREVIREFVNQMILNGKDLAEARKFLSSDELMEALQLISSDEELFLALLQNPNSLLSKSIQELANSQGTNDREYKPVTGSNFIEHNLGNREQTRETVNHRKHNFFRKKAKSQQKTLMNEDEKAEFSNRIVILKPGLMGLQNSDTGNNLTSLLDSHDTAKHGGPSARGSSHFSLTDLKKKLKNAMGRERHANPEVISKKHPAETRKVSHKAIVKDNVGMRSPNKDHFFIEKIAKPSIGATKGGKKDALKDSELIAEQESSSYPRKRVSNLYTEAKKHLSEMVGNGDDNMNMSSRQVSKTLGRILSVPEYNFSPLCSPGRDWEHHFVTAQTRFSTSDRTWEASEFNVSPKKATFVDNVHKETNNRAKKSSIRDESSIDIAQEIESDSNFSVEHQHVDKAEDRCPVQEEIVNEVDVESTKEINILESTSEPIDISTEKEEDQGYDILEIPESAGFSQSLKLEVTEENQQSPLPSPRSSITKKTEELDGGADICGRPSPVSVLDTQFIEDEVGPGHPRFEPVQVPVRPLHIQFEEQDYSPVNLIRRGKYGLEENELIYRYIEAVLQASRLTMDQLLIKCISSDKILDPLDPSLFDREELVANQLCHDQKLLYDCINEILMEVCWNHFVASPWVFFVNPCIMPNPNMKMVTLKVCEGVCWHLLPLPSPCTLDKIVKRDTEKPNSWMDLRLEAETVGFEMGEIILAELMEDTIMSCIGQSPEDNSVVASMEKH